MDHRDTYRELNKIKRDFIINVSHNIIKILTHQDQIGIKNEETYSDFVERSEDYNKESLEKFFKSLSNKTKRLIPIYIGEMSIIYLCSIAEDRLNKMIYLILGLENTIEISAEEISKNKIIKNQIKWINESVFGRLKYLNKELGYDFINTFSGKNDLLSNIKELILVRNLIVHNGAIITEDFLKKTNNKFNDQNVGEKLNLTFGDIQWYSIFLDLSLKQICHQYAAKKEVIKINNYPRNSV
ncbi:hypothetical protein [Aestuariibaculum lutulentum]|uniref:RiboL-PSP-HEPN domain-containing protein n=1 Tax=Aestuariibaculum lutulentum TaxID=2920935 RepID=A0ABS9RI36_9FLAO|nr:hypothetical protein [Aestuariibaculum lutulentum]MCH4552547.1 hypothetical protein [Aestuariibaculum lutulentum]